MARLLDSLFRFPTDPTTTLDHVTSVLNLMGLPVLVMDKRFHIKTMNRRGEERLKRYSIKIGDRSSRGNYAAFRALIRPCIIETLKSFRATLVPNVPPPDIRDVGFRTIVCPGRIQKADVAFVIGFPDCEAEFSLESALTSIFESFRVGALLVGPDLRLKIFSESALGVFKLKREDAVGRRTSQLNPSEQAKVLERQFKQMMLDRATRIEEAYPVASSKMGVVRARLVAWPVWTAEGACEGLMILVRPLEAQVTALRPDSKAMEMLGREGYAFGPPMFYTHVDGTISLMSAAARELVGGAGTDRPANFKTDLKWAHPEVIEAVYADFVRGSRFSTVMADLHTPEGLKPMRIVGHGIQEVGDITSQVFIVVNDASEYENTRKMLAETVKNLATQNEVMDKALDALDMPIAVFDSDLRVMRINTAIARRLEISPQDAVGRDIADVISTARKAGMADLLKKAMDQWEEIHVPRYEHVTKNGETVPLEAVLHPLRIEGKPCCLAISREMADLATLERQSARWAAVSQALMAGTRDGVVILDGSGVVVAANEVMLRRRPRGLATVGKPASDLLAVSDRKMLTDLLGRAYASDKPMWSGPLALTKSRTGERVVMDIDFAPLLGKSGRTDGMVCVIHYTAGRVSPERDAKCYTENLERLVRERTEEISAANNLLAETVDRITSIAESGMLLSSLKDPGAVFRSFLDQTKDFLGAAFVSLAVVEKQGGVPRTTYYSAGTAPASDVMASPEIEAGMAHLVLGIGAGRKVRTAGPRLLLADVELGGAKGLMVVTKPEGEFGRIEMGLVGLLCTQIGFALPIASYLVDVKAGRERAECLRRIAVAVAGASSPDDAMKCIAQEIAGVLPIARMFWMVPGSDGQMWVSEIYNRAGRAAAGALRLEMSGEAGLLHHRAVASARGRSFCEILEGQESGGLGAAEGEPLAKTCPFRVRPDGSSLGPRIAAMLRDGGIVPRDGGSVAAAPVMLSEGSWSLLCALLEDGAALMLNDTCFICVAASTLAYVWKAADCASVVRGLRAASETVCDLVHDIKYPINKMWSDLEALEKSCGASGASLDGVAAIKSSLDSLRALTDELCEIANPASRKPEIIDVNDVVEHCLSLLSADLAAKAIRITKGIPAVPPIYADRRDVVRVVLNVLGNGVEAVAANGLIRIGAASGEMKPGVRSVSVIFEDSGPGVPEGDVRRVFDAFFTTKKGGSGLGLFSARKRAQANGGDVTCEIVDGGKSRFVATFPAVVG